MVRRPVTTGETAGRRRRARGAVVRRPVTTGETAGRRRRARGAVVRRPVIHEAGLARLPAIRGAGVRRHAATRQEGGPSLTIRTRRNCVSEHFILRMVLPRWSLATYARTPAHRTGLRWRISRDRSTGPAL